MQQERAFADPARPNERNALAIAQKAKDLTQLGFPADEIIDPPDRPTVEKRIVCAHSDRNCNAEWPERVAVNPTTKGFAAPGVQATTKNALRRGGPKSVLPQRGRTRTIEHMNDEVATLLRRLGVNKGARHIRPAPAPRPTDEASARRGAPQPLETLLPGGRVAQCEEGACFIVDHVYPLQHRHGPDALADLLALQPGAAARYALDGRINGQQFHDFVFLDTETTGLAGAGALAFIVGVAYFEPQLMYVDGEMTSREVVVTRQYFLRDHGDEMAMLRQLTDLLADRAGLITFNGRSFDVPLLDNRYLLNRMRSPLFDLAHIDLLPPARRLFRARLGSCSLSALEQNLLGVRRSHDDVPGWLIPSLYYDYLRSGDAAQLVRVFYHNEMDVLSMVTLAARIFRQLGSSRCDDALDQVSLGRWQADLGLTEEAEATLRAALEGDLPLEAYHQTLYRLGTLYKQGGRRAEAVVVWQQIAFTSTGDVTAHVELAKHYEWHDPDLAAAIRWTRAALDLLERLPLTPNTRLARAELNHRLERLQKKGG